MKRIAVLSDRYLLTPAHSRRLHGDVQPLLTLLDHDVLTGFRQFWHVLERLAQRRRGERKGLVVLEVSAKLAVVVALVGRRRRGSDATNVVERQFTGQDYAVGAQATDELDAARTAAPLRPADDAVVLDTTNLDADQAFAARKLACAARILAQRILRDAHGHVADSRVDFAGRVDNRSDAIIVAGDPPATHP